MSPSTYDMLAKLLYRTYLLHMFRYNLTHTHRALSNARRISLLDLLTASDVLNLLLE